MRAIAGMARSYRVLFLKQKSRPEGRLFHRPEHHS